MRNRTILIVLLAALAILPLVAHTSLAAKPTKKPKPPPEPASPAIAYVEPQTEIWVMDADGSHQTRIYDAAQWVFTLSWSPDGRKLAFTDSFDLWVIDVDVIDGVPEGSDATRLHVGTVKSLCWSPLGDQIVFEESIDGPPSDLYLIDVSGGDPELLYRSPDDRNVGNPAWSPDGSQIAFCEGTGGQGPYIKLLDPDTGLVEEVVTQWAAWPRCIAWARAKAVLAIQAAMEDGATVHTLDLATGQATYRFDDSDWVTWSPDDAKLLYGSLGKKGKQAGLWTYALTSGATEKISGSGRWPDWMR